MKNDSLHRMTLAIGTLTVLAAVYPFLHIPLFGWLSGKGFVPATENTFASVGGWMSGISAVVVQLFVVYLLVITYRSQKEELAAQRDQLSAQERQLQQANTEAVRKRFEDSFFALLARYDGVVNALRIYTTVKSTTGWIEKYHDPSNSGRGVFLTIIRQVDSALRSATKPVQPDDAGSMESFESAIATVLTTHEDALGDWTRIILVIIRHLDEADLDVSLKHQYVKFLRGTMSRDEAQVLAFSLLRRRTNSDTVRFLIDANFFKHAALATAPFGPELNERFERRFGRPLYVDAAS